MLNKEKIINVKFSRSRKGYDIEQVDAFLDEIVDDLTVIERERAAEAERMVKVQESENALAQALLIAQKAANDLETKANENAKKVVEDAQTEADEIINNAKVEAYNIREKYEAEISELKAELERIREFVETYKSAVLADMDQHKEAFINGFGSEAILEASEFVSADVEAADTENDEEVIELEEVTEVPETEPEEEVAEEESEVAVEPVGELQTDNIGTINLDDILHGLPENDVELKALIDEIME